jgi:hypothetical protein
METMTSIALNAVAWTQDHVLPVLGDPTFLASLSLGFALTWLLALLVILRKLTLLKKEIDARLGRLHDEIRRPAPDDGLMSEIRASLNGLRDEIWRLAPSESLLSELRLELGRFRSDSRWLLPDEEQLLQIRRDLERLRNELAAD